ncbi:hypothetical protein lerEdw1_008770 [Lerista edwardsae]|nr:hypothetical protein lerEdw1_008770 [Lerista edwardsae]
MALEDFHHRVANSSLLSPKWKANTLRALWDEKLRNEARFNETAFVAPWFQERLRPFLSAVSTDMLRCLHNETLQCAQYQAIVKGLDVEFTKLSAPMQEEVFRSFQLPYLERVRSNGTACAEGPDSATWLTVNFWRFGRYAQYRDLAALNSEFSGLDVLGNLTVKQLAELSATGGALRTPADAQKVMAFVDTSTVTEYVDEFSRQVNVRLSREIQASLLQPVLALAQPILQKVDDAGFRLWVERRLPVLIPGLNSSLVPLLFGHLESRNVSAIRAVTSLLNSSIGEFSNATRESIFRAVLSVTSNVSLRDYAPNSSFVAFLRESFQGFEDFLTLRDVESLIPAPDLRKVVNTIPPEALADLLSRKGFLNQDSFLTAVLQNYQRNGAFMDSGNQKGVLGSLPNVTKEALLAGVWPTVMTSSNNTELDLWLGARLAHYFMFLNGDMLNTSETLNASCATFRKIISKLNNDSEVFQGREEELYYSIKAYLAATKEKPRCYNATDPETSDWLVTYLGNFIRYSSARDMRSLTNRSAATFQDLAFNPDNLELVSKTRIRKDLAEMYAAALFAEDAEFSLGSLPDQLLCFARHSTLISALSPADALSLIARVNRHCGAPKPSASDRQLATMLVAQVKTLNGQTLVALGQQAVGLTVGQISSLPGHDLVDPEVLASLGHVLGWSRGQAQALVNKLLRSNFTLDTLEKFERLGTLAQGLPSSTFEKISAELAIGLAKNPTFLATLRQGPEHVKKVFVGKVLSNSSSFSDILNYVPDDLVDQVPNSLLALRGSTPDLGKINEKHWSPQQAAVFFGDVLARVDNYTQLSPFVLQGFQCSAASELTPGRLSSLAKAVKVKEAVLNNEQLSCLAKLLTRSSWAVENLTQYSPDVLLFFPLGKVDAPSCRRFYSLASRGNLSLLANGSAQRTALLGGALSCFGVGNASLLGAQQLRELGAFVCDLDAATIEDSAPGILENLKLCPDLTGAQRAALNTRLSSGRTPYGPPASWDEATLEGLGPLAFYIDSTTWASINQEERTAFFKSVAGGYDSQSAAQRERTAAFLKSVGSKPASSRRTKRAVEPCRSTSITADTLEDPLFIVQYDSAQQFDACLSNEVLKANLASLLEQPLPNDYLAVIRRKLDEIYPGGIPEDQLKVLGFLSRQYSVDAIGRWNVTSSDTLAALLNPDNGPWEQPQLVRLVGRYMELGGTLAGPVLAMLGGKYLCFLDEDQLKQISPEAMRDAGKLDISSCSQGKKDLLYGKAHTAFAGQEGTRAYYPLIQPYLGGAPVEDLKKLTGSEIAMDINTFTNLKPEELQKLSVQDVRSLLGVNLPDLKEVENRPSVALWIRSHFQSELDTLGIGLTGGMTTASSTPTSGTISGSPTAGSPAIPVTGSSISSTNTMATSINPFHGVPVVGTGTMATSSSATPVSTTTTGLASITPTAAPDSYSTPDFQSTTVAKDRPTFADATSTTVPAIVRVPKAAFPTNVTGTPFGVTATSEDAVTERRNSTASEEATADSTTASATNTAVPTTTEDSTIAAPTDFIATSASIVATSEDAVSGTPAPSTLVKNTTTSREATADSNTTTSANSTAVPVTTEDSALAAPTSFVTASSSVTATSNDMASRALATAIETNTPTSVDTTDASGITTTERGALPPPSTDMTAITATNLPTLTVGTNHTFNASDAATTPTMLSMTATSSKGPPVPPKPMPNATAPVSISTTTKTTHKTPPASSKSTVRVPETSHKAAAPPRPVRTTPLAATRRTTSRPVPKTRPPSYPTPNGYINVRPLSVQLDAAVLLGYRAWPTPKRPIFVLAQTRPMSHRKELCRRSLREPVLELELHA